MFNKVFYLFVLIILVFSACKILVDPVPNKAPYNVTASFVSQSYDQNSGNRTFQLEIDQVGGLSDPDGDVVKFKSLTLPSWITLAEATGVVTVDTTTLQSSVSFDFWSEDEHGEDTSGEAFRVFVEVVAVVVNRAPYNVTVSSGSQIFNQNSGNRTFQLEIEKIGGLSDPDGDVVYFRSDIPSGSWLSLNENSGLVTAGTTDPQSPVSFSFWSEDDEGLATTGTAVSVSFEVNQAPVASIETSGFAVSGAIDFPAVNQKYTDSGNVSYSQAVYSGNGTPSYQLFLCVVSGIGYYWGIQTSWNGSGFYSSTSDLVYYIQSTASYPPGNGWVSSSDNSSASLQISEVPISGDVSSFGNILNLVYQFTDPEGDTEGVSTFQWYRCTSKDEEGTAILGATSIDYTTTAADDGMFLKVEVIPVDEHGFSGNPVKSEASREIGTS